MNLIIRTIISSGREILTQQHDGFFYVIYRRSGPGFSVSGPFLDSDKRFK